MRFKTLSGRPKDVNITKLMIDWDGDFGSLFEAEFADWIYPYWRHDVVVCQLPVAGTRLSIDFFNVSRRIAVENQGRQHQEYVPFLSGSRTGYLSQIKRDLMKAEWCRVNDIKLVEILPEDLPLTKSFFKDRYDIDL